MRCNEAINAILKNGVEASSKYGSKGRGVFGNVGSALLSPLEFATRAVNEGDITKAMIDTYGKDKEFMLGKAVGGEELHSVLTQQLMDLGVKIWMERMALVQEISPLIVRYYEMLAGIGDEVAVSYKSAVFDFLREKELSEEILRDAFAHKLEVLDFSERMQGLTLSGPHKDDLLLSLHGHEMRSSGSQGQCRSAAIALRLSV